MIYYCNKSAKQVPQIHSEMNISFISSIYYELHWNLHLLLFQLISKQSDN